MRVERWDYLAPRDLVAYDVDAQVVEPSYPMVDQIEKLFLKLV